MEGNTLGELGANQEEGPIAWIQTDLKVTQTKWLTSVNQFSDAICCALFLMKNKTKSKDRFCFLSNKFARCQVLYVSCNNSVNLYLLSTYYILGPAPLSRKFIDK